MPTQAPHKPPLREQFTLEGVEQLVKTFLDLQHNVFEAAGRFGLTLAELEEALSWPEAQELLTRAQRLSALRTQPALDLIFPCAIDRLASVMFDEQAPAEARRKSAALLARICESRRRDRPRPASPHAPDPSTAPTIPAPTPTTTPRETTTPDDIAEEPLPAPLLRYIPAEPDNAAPEPTSGETTSDERISAEPASAEPTSDKPTSDEPASDATATSDRRAIRPLPPLFTYRRAPTPKSPSAPTEPCPADTS